MNDKLNAFYGQFKKSEPEVYFNKPRNEYVIKQTGDPILQDWVSLPKAEVLDMLKDYGIRTSRLKGEDRSPGEEYMAAIRNNTVKTIKYAGPLGGYMPGLCRVGSFSALITEGPKIPKAIKGEFGYVKSIIDQLFGDQAKYIYAYMSLSRRQLLAGLMRSMPAIVMVGPKECGKSFFQSFIMTPFLGGRGVNITDNLTGKEKFSGLIYQNEHLLMGDAKLSNKACDRRDLGSHIKSLVATEDQVMRVMYVDPLGVRTFTRITISLNDEPENITGLPMMDDSLEDKMFIFRVKEVQWPVMAFTPEDKEKFRVDVIAQIPAFCWWLDNEYHIPEELTRNQATGKPARFCLNHYHDPYILRMLTEMSPEFNLLELIRQAYFTVPTLTNAQAKTYHGPEQIRMSALDLSQGLRGDDSPTRADARTLLPNGSRIGTLLERLHSKFPENVYQERTAKNRFWVIKGVDSMLSSTLI